MPVYSLGPDGITARFRSKSKSQQKKTQEEPQKPKEYLNSTTLVPHDIAAWKLALQGGIDPNTIWTEQDLKQEWLEHNSGADINLYNALGRTALMEAVHNHRNKTVDFLIDHGADLKAPVVDGMFQETFYWVTHEQIEVDTLPIYEAIRFADAHMVHKLAEGGADLNRVSREGWKPLDIALLDKQGPTIEALLKHGGHFSSVVSRQLHFRDEFRIMARKLFSASTHRELFPSQDLLEVYWWVISTPDTQEILSARGKDISPSSRRLIKRFFNTLCEIAKVEDLQVKERPFCSQCVAFQKWACPTYEARSDGHDIVIYDDPAVFELYPLRDLLEESARVGCPLCSMIADGIDKQESYQRRWIDKEDETKMFFFFDKEVVGAVSLELVRPGSSFSRLRILTGSSLNFILNLTHLDEDTILNKCHYNDRKSETKSPEAFKLAKHWLSTCELSHNTCKKFCSGEMPLPTRVIDVGDETRAPFLFRSQGLKGRYCALSYCWGKATSSSSLYKTTKANLSSHENAMPLHELPATLQDAIIVARNLGFQYIWIDAVCIVQDDGAEWAYEAARMQHVYAGASFTISTVASRSSEDGLFRPRQTRN